MKTIVVLSLLFASSLLSHAACSAAGLSEGGLKSGAVGAAASTFQVSSPGCNFYVTSITGNLLNWSNSTGTAIYLNTYQNATCTGTANWTAAVGVGAAKGSFTPYTVTFNPAILIGPNGFCIGFANGDVGIIETVGFVGYFNN